MVSGRVKDEKTGGNKPALEQDHRVGKVVEGTVVEKGVAVEIAPLPHLRPRRIDAEGHDLEERVDDPDAEVFPRPPGESEAEGPG